MSAVSIVMPDPAQGWRGRLGPVLISGVWLVYLAQPLQRIIAHPMGPAQGLGVVALGTFCVTYLVVFSRARRLRGRAAPRPDGTTVGLLVLLLLFSAAMVPAAGSAALAGLVYLSAAAMMTLPVRVGWVVAAALLVLTEGSGLLVPGWSDATGAGLGIVLAGFAVFGMRMALERNRQLLAAREEMAAMAVSAERERMARDLHDILGHSLTVITVKAELAGRLLELDPGRAATEVADLERLSREALADVRATIGGYREVTLAGELVNARSALEAAGIQADLPGAVDDVPGERRELFGWAVREGVTNVVRHSGAQRCTVRVGRDHVEVLDDGCGAGGPVAGQGHGLAGLRARAHAAGATMTVGRAGDRGFRLRVEATAAGA